MTKVIHIAAGVLEDPSPRDALIRAQLKGLLGGLAGAAEYEHLINRPDQAMAGMRPQSVGHIVIIGFILFGNLAYFLGRNRT